MSNIKFSQLPNQTTVTDSTTIPTVDSGTNYTVTGANLKTYMSSTTGNITGGNILTGGKVSATGNVQGNYIIGNGALLTGVVTSSYGNSNVTTLLAGFGSNALSTTGNVTASYHIGNGSLLSNITGANVTGNVSIATTSGYATAAGSATTAVTAGTVTTAAQPNITSVGTLSSLSVSGNVSANYFIGNGAALTGIVATTTYGNSNVAAYLPTYSGNLNPGNLTTTGAISATGNVTGAYIKGNGASLTGTVTSIVAGSGISVNVSTGAVTVTATGGGSGGSSISNGFAFANTAATTSSGGNIVWIYNGDVTPTSTWASNTVIIQNQQQSVTSEIILSPQGSIVLTAGSYSNASQGGNIDLYPGTSVGGQLGVVNLYNLVSVHGFLTITTGYGNTFFNSSGISTTSPISTSAPIDASSATGTGLTIPRATAAVTRTYVGQAGSIRAVTDSPTYAGQLAYWCTTATAQWRYVATNTAV